MKLIVFGANGPTGLELCRQALAAGHLVTAAVRRPDEFPFQNESPRRKRTGYRIPKYKIGNAASRGVFDPDRNNGLTVVRANVMVQASLAPVISDSEAVLSTLGAGYSRHEIRVYSVGTKAIVDAMRASDHCRRLVVVSAGLAVPQLPEVRGRGFFQDNIMLPLLRNIIGRTLYEDMLRMEDFLASCDDIAWTIMRPGRLINGSGVSAYRLAEYIPAGNVTTRPDLAAAMLAELGPDGHVHKKMAPTTR